MKTDVSKKFAIDFRASLDKANGERPRDGSGRFGVDREGRGKAREEAKMGTGEAREQIRDLKNQGKPEEAHALEDHLRRMSNRLGEARARMLPDTMHLHGIRPPIPAKRTTFERPEIIVPKEDPVAKEGTSEGAELGWETRRRGGAAPEGAGAPHTTEVHILDEKAAGKAFVALQANRELREFRASVGPHKKGGGLIEFRNVPPSLMPKVQAFAQKHGAASVIDHEDSPKKEPVKPVQPSEEKPQVVAAEPAKPAQEPSKEPEKPPTPQKDTKGRTIVPDKVAEEGAGLAEKLHRASQDLDGTSKEKVRLELSQLKRDKKLLPEARVKYEEASKKYNEATKASDDFQKKTGHDVIGAWQAQTGRSWPHYRVESAAGTVHPQFVVESKAEKSKDTEDEDAETEGERETPRRRPLPAEARAVMPVGTKKPPRPPGPPQPKQMRVGPRKIEGPRLMPVTTPRNPTYVEVDR
jgi:hypothetical protein